ncbi:MAG: hypothetical protein FJ164_14045 [Gammaproteobacteria bacterium]|nr:hypothetical protein [Gammaproteobacteria bacterium]
MTLPRFRSGSSSQGYFRYREAHHEAALRGVQPADTGGFQLRLELPQFPLEALLRGTGDGVAVALCADDTRVITHTNGAAASHGVRPGMSLRAAQAFCPELAGLLRDPAAERQALAQLTHFLALGRHHVECVPADSDAWASTGLFALRVSGYSRSTAGDPAQALKRDLRALGYRATVFAGTSRPLATVRMQPALNLSEPSTRVGGEWCSHLHLPWLLTKRHDINLALQRLEADLGLALQVSGREVDWLQLCLVSERGGRVHHGVEQLAAGTWKRAMSELRARMHREPGLRVGAMELRAGLGEPVPAAGARRHEGLQ